MFRGIYFSLRVSKSTTKTYTIRLTSLISTGPSTCWSESTPRTLPAMTSFEELCNLLVPVASPQPPIIPQDESTSRMVDQFPIYDLLQEICDLIFTSVCKKLPKLEHIMKINNLNITLAFTQKYDTGLTKARAEQHIEEPSFLPRI